MGRHCRRLLAALILAVSVGGVLFAWTLRRGPINEFGARGLGPAPFTTAAQTVARGEPPSAASASAQGAPAGNSPKADAASADDVEELEAMPAPRDEEAEAVAPAPASGGVDASSVSPLPQLYVENCTYGRGPPQRSLLLASQKLMRRAPRVCTEVPIRTADDLAAVSSPAPSTDAVPRCSLRTTAVRVRWSGLGAAVAATERHLWPRGEVRGLLPVLQAVLLYRDGGVFATHVDLCEANGQEGVLVVDVGLRPNGAADYDPAARPEMYFERHGPKGGDGDESQQAQSRRGPGERWAAAGPGAWVGFPMHLPHGVARQPGPRAVAVYTLISPQHARDAEAAWDMGLRTGSRFGPSCILHGTTPSPYSDHGGFGGRCGGDRCFQT